MNDLINIVMPVYNEGENIKNTLTEIGERIKTPFRIFIVFDFDEDDTLPAIKPLQNKYNILLVKNKYGRGVLNAIKTGIENITDGIVLVSMADLSDDYSVVDAMLKKINDGYDIVCGSRYIKGGMQIGGPRFKGFLSRMAGLSLHYLTGIPTHDISNSFKMYTKNVLKNITIESTGGFELGMEIVVKAYLLGFKITELPSTWRDRNAGNSKFKLWKWLPHYLRWYFFLLKAKLFRNKECLQ